MELEKVLTDTGTTSVRLVTNPEKMVIKEVSAGPRLSQSLQRRYRPGLIANRIIPDTVQDPFFQRWKEQQQQ